jgi:hypothetical protein
MWLVNLEESKNTTRRAQSLVGSKNNLLHTSSGHVEVNGIVNVPDIVVLIYLNFDIDKK